MLRAWLLLLALLWPGAPRAETLLILTSYEAEVVAPIVEAFEAAHPQITVRHLNKNTPAAVSEILSGNGRRFDLFWDSSAEAFEVLKAAGRLEDLGKGAYTDFAYSAVGWSWRIPFEGQVPLDWNDLLLPELAGRIAMSHPMQSGSTHSLIETILQHRGWRAGWAWLLELAGQLRTVSARSFGVLQGIEEERWDVGLTIDFLALKRARQGFVFRYGRPIIIIPARIAALKNGRAPEAATDFIDFVTSTQGQRLLLHPDLRRIPVDPVVQAELAETLLPEVRAALHLSWSSYDPHAASRRYRQVNELFDIFIARDFLRRRDLWRRVRALEQQAERPLGQARALLTHMPFSEQEVMAAELDQELLKAWARQAEALLDQVEELLAAEAMQ